MVLSFATIPCLIFSITLLQEALALKIRLPEFVSAGQRLHLQWLAQTGDPSAIDIYGNCHGMPSVFYELASGIPTSSSSISYLVPEYPGPPGTHDCRIIATKSESFSEIVSSTKISLVIPGVDPQTVILSDTSNSKSNTTQLHSVPSSTAPAIPRTNTDYNTLGMEPTIISAKLVLSSTLASSGAESSRSTVPLSWTISADNNTINPAILGGVVGGVVLLSTVGSLLFHFSRRHRYQVIPITEDLCHRQLGIRELDYSDQISQALSQDNGLLAFEETSGLSRRETQLNQLLHLMTERILQLESQQKEHRWLLSEDMYRRPPPEYSPSSDPRRIV